MCSMSWAPFWYIFISWTMLLSTLKQPIAYEWSFIIFPISYLERCFRLINHCCNGRAKHINGCDRSNFSLFCDSFWDLGALCYFYSLISMDLWIFLLIEIWKMFLSKHKRLWISINVFKLEGDSLVCWGREAILGLFCLWKLLRKNTDTEGRRERKRKRVGRIAAGGGLMWKRI